MRVSGQTGRQCKGLQAEADDFDVKNLMLLASVMLQRTILKREYATLF
jgi:hypothetical protein